LNQPGPGNLSREIANDEIDLVDLFLIIWKRKWMIVAVTLLVSVAAAGISLVLPAVYRVVTILEPGKDAEGKLVENPQSIRENIISGAYNQVIAEATNLPLAEIPIFNVSVPKQTDLVKISVDSSKPEISIIVLKALLALISETMDAQLNIKKSLVENELKAALVKEKALPQQIRQLELLTQETKSKIAELENTRKQSLPNPGSDGMSILLYLNEIQNQQVFLNTLFQELIELKGNQERAAINVSNLQLKLASIHGTNIKKQPSIPEKPIKPKKTLIVALAFILALMGGIMLAFLAEFMIKVRRAQEAVE